MKTSEIINAVRDYYIKRALKFPSFENAMKFVVTEIAEVYELDLARIGGWVRNNPENKPNYSKEMLAEELGDAILMLLVAGIVEGVDPLDAMLKKMKRKIELKAITGVSKLVPVTDEEAERVFNEVENGQ